MNNDRSTEDSDIPLSPRDSAAFVQKWIIEQGVALEMKATQAFRSRNGFNLSLASEDHGLGYLVLDASTGVKKWRETDVVVKRTKITHSNVWVSVWLIIECKSDKSAPWILYSDSSRPKQLSNEPFRGLWEIKHTETLVPQQIMGSLPSKYLSNSDLTSCYSISTALKVDRKGESRNPARDSLLQVVSALEGLRESFVLDAYRHHVAVFIPVVVTSAPIFMVTLPMTGDYSIEEKQQVLYRGQIDPEKESLNSIWIIAEKALDEFADSILNEISNLDYRNS